MKESHGFSPPAEPQSGEAGQIALRLTAVTTEKDEWLRAHQGRLVGIVGWVWWCGDEECDCTRPEILARYENISDRRWRVNRLLWEGEFRTDGEPGAEEELLAKKAELERVEPEMASRIKWTFSQVSPAPPSEDRENEA